MDFFGFFFLPITNPQRAIIHRFALLLRGKVRLVKVHSGQVYRLQGTTAKKTKYWQTGSCIILASGFSHSEMYRAAGFPMECFLFSQNIILFFETVLSLSLYRRSPRVRSNGCYAERCNLQATPPLSPDWLAPSWAYMSPDRTFARGISGVVVPKRGTIRPRPPGRNSTSQHAARLSTWAGLGVWSVG